MKIFGLEITRAKKIQQEEVSIKDAPPVVLRNIQPTTKPISQIPVVNPKVLKYAQGYTSGRGQFVAPEYDLAEIGIVEDVDAYVRQSFKKKQGLMFKEGLAYTGPNQDTLRYTKTRFAQIARASNLPHIELLKSIAHSLIRVSNAYLIKVRDVKASGGRTYRNAAGKLKKPVAAYFPAAPETMYVEIDKDTGKVLGWRQELPDGAIKDYQPDDVIHFVIDRREGFLFGVPTLVPVLDDIRALRQIEENVEMLLYQHLFPLFQYKVGDETHPAGLTEDGRREIDVVKDEIRLMPLEGGIVTPGYHEITAVGAEGRAVRAEGYLTHFKKRVFAGLGVSEVDMGDGQTANRATANVLSRALVDSVKAIQDSLEDQWDHHVISELLMESTFGDNVLEEENMVHLKFKEIDILNKIDLENHYIEVFKANGITFSEFRTEMGREPITVPEDPNDQDPTKNPEWFNTYWKLFEEPLALIKAVDEPYSVASQAALASRSLSITSKEVDTSKKETEANLEKEAKAKAAARPPVSRAKKDHFLGSLFTQFEEDTIDNIRQGVRTTGRLDRDYLLAYARAWAGQAAKQLGSATSVELINGFNQATGGLASRAVDFLTTAREAILNRTTALIERLAVQTIRLINNRVETLNIAPSEFEKAWVAEARLAFDTLHYRIDFIYDVELKKAYNYGIVFGLRYLGSDNSISITVSSDSCDRCQAASLREEHINHTTLDDIPPLHASCKCGLEIIQNSPVEDGAKLERCVLKVKASLRKEHPDWDADRIKSSAFAICNSRLK